MRVDGAGHGDLLVEVLNTQEGQFQHGDRAVLVAVIAGAELGHFERADGDTIEVFAVLGQTTVGDVHRELSVGLFGNQFGHLFDMLSEGAAFAPNGNIPFGGQGFGCKGESSGSDGQAADMLVHQKTPPKSGGGIRTEFK